MVEVGAVVKDVVVASCDTTSCAALDADVVKSLLPLYVAAMVSVPAGAVFAMHDAAPELRVPVQSVTAPVLKVTLPFGVPPLEVTVAENVALVP